MALRLVKGSYKYRDQMIEMLKEWIAYNNAHLEANPSPAVIFKNDYHFLVTFFIEKREYQSDFIALVS